MQYYSTLFNRVFNSEPSPGEGEHAQHGARPRAAPGGLREQGRGPQRREHAGWHSLPSANNKGYCSSGSYFRFFGAQGHFGKSR